jgi:hypothetical protein
MKEVEDRVPPELEVTAEELKHVRANVYDHTVVCLPAAYVRAVPGLAANVSGGYVVNSDDPRVSDAKTLWVGRARELAVAMKKFKKTEVVLAESTAEGTENDASSEMKRASREDPKEPVGDGVAAIETLASLESTGLKGTVVKPAVVFVSGSSGVAGDTLRYLRMIAAEGHLVLCPDDFCGWPARLRHRTPRSIKPWVARSAEASLEPEARGGGLGGADDTDREKASGGKDSESSAHYWSSNLLYRKSETPTGELVYESCAEEYTSSDRLAMVYDTTLAVKHAALTKLLLDLPKPMAKKGIFLAGNSEGAIVLGMMDDAMLDPSSEQRRKSVDSRPTHGGSIFSGILSGLSGLALGGESVWEAKLLGRINIAYSLEPNYFTYRTIKKSRKTDDDGGVSSDANRSIDASREGVDGASLDVWNPDARRAPSRSNASSPAPPPRGLFGSRWRTDVPTLCINGSADQFFGRRNSVSEKVIHRSSDSLIKKGDRPTITGDAGQRIAELGMTRAFVAQMEGAKHAMCGTHDAALRATLRSFLQDPERCAFIPEQWEREDAEEERWDRTMLWRSVVTPGRCSFASVAATETRDSFSSLARVPKSLAQEFRDFKMFVDAKKELGRTGKANPNPPRGDSRRENAEEDATGGVSLGLVSKNASPRGSEQNASPSSSRDVSLHGSHSFLDLTSSLARLVRPASWNLSASPISLTKSWSESVQSSPERSVRRGDSKDGPRVAEEGSNAERSARGEVDGREKTTWWHRVQRWVWKKTFRHAREK